MPEVIELKLSRQELERLEHIKDLYQISETEAVKRALEYYSENVLGIG